MTDHRSRVLSQIISIGRTVPSASVEPLCAWLESLGGASTQEALECLPPIPDPETRTAFLGAIHEWGRSDSNPDLGRLAWAIRSASAMDDRLRREGSLELVWTGPSPAVGQYRRTSQALTEVVQAAQRDLWIVTFAGSRLPLLTQTLQKVFSRGIQIRLVVEDPSAGTVTYSALDGLGKELLEIVTPYVWPVAMRPRDEAGHHGALHMKCALADDRLLLVSSANLTGHAMELNMEMGILVRGGDVPRRTRDHLQWLMDERILVKATGAAMPPERLESQ